MENEFLLGWLRLIRLRLRRRRRFGGFIVLADLVDDFQLSAILLIAAKADVVPVLNDRLSLVARYQHQRLSRQQVLSFVDSHPVVIDQSGSANHRKIAGNLIGDLLEPYHAIQLAIYPDTSARPDNRPRPRADQL